jgi:hypothetical protein
LKPLSTFEADENGGLDFDAQLLQDLAGSKAGDTVSVELDLFNPEGGFMNLCVGNQTGVHLPVQLLMGHTTTSPDFAGLMSSNMGQPA